MNKRTAGWVALAGSTGLTLGFALAAILLTVQPAEIRLPASPPPPRYAQLVSTRTFLPPKQRQQSGFGLYTYVLFRKHPTEKEVRSRYREALRSFLSLESVGEFATATPRQRELLNLTAVPVWSLKGDLTINRKNADPLLDLLVDREYRYSGAERMLSAIPEAGGLAARGESR